MPQNLQAAGASAGPGPFRGEPVDPGSVQVPEYVAKFAAEYQIEQFRKFFCRVDIRGKTVLEIGSDYHLVTARLFAANGAARVAATNIADWKSAEPLPSNVEFLVGDVCDVNLQVGAYDIVYGIAILEHLPDLERTALAVERLLKPDGLAYLQGYPLWPGSVGHHVWLEEAAGDGEGASEEVVFNFSDQARNPIPDWAHLALGRERLLALLIDRGVPASRAQRALDYVYNVEDRSTASCSNFKAASEILAAFEQRFHVEARRDLDQHSNEYFEAARQHYSEDDLRTLGLDLWLRPRGTGSKPANERRGFWDAVKANLDRAGLWPVSGR